MHVSCMATKTISIDIEAYERLRRARRTPNESFSRVIKRATWEAFPCTGRHLLEVLRELAPTEGHVLDRLDEVQATDRPPEDPWRER